jgi:hypothetical protein
MRDAHSAASPAHAVDERLVDFQNVDGDSRQLVERGVTSTKVIDRDSNAE